MIILRMAIIVLGFGFFIPGLIGVVQPERLAEALALAPEPQIGIEAVRVLIGAPYLAMAVITLYAAVRRHWALLAPIAAIEGFMAVARIFSGITDGFETSTLRYFSIEMVICLVLSLGVILPARNARQHQSG